MARSLRTLAVLELRLHLRSPDAVAVVVVIPVLAALVLQGAFRTELVAEGYRHANGVEQTVPGMFVSFAGFLVSVVSWSFYRDYGWRTWDRLRWSGVPRGVLVAAKLMPGVLLACAQAIVLFAVGVAALHLHIRGSLLALGAVVLALAVDLALLAGAIVVLCSSFDQVNALGSCVAVAFAALGGAALPTASLPHWVQAIAPAIPSHWAMDAFGRVILGGAGLEAVLPALGAMALFALAASALGVGGLRLRAVKRFA